jgi:hypothetical protein
MTEEETTLVAAAMQHARCEYALTPLQCERGSVEWTDDASASQENVHMRSQTVIPLMFLVITGILCNVAMAGVQKDGSARTMQHIIAKAWCSVALPDLHRHQLSNRWLKFAGTNTRALRKCACIGRPLADAWVGWIVSLHATEHCMPRTIACH